MVAEATHDQCYFKNLESVVERLCARELQCQQTVGRSAKSAPVQEIVKDARRRSRRMSGYHGYTNGRGETKGKLMELLCVLLLAVNYSYMIGRSLCQLPLHLLIHTLGGGTHTSLELASSKNAT